ncbi:MAG TPA: hypothetical protein VG056_02870 [Pirellulales bacterium]|jgi:hypothetical protein|nr:hypothetical protein [Pirellulales bacterium]
MSEISSYVKLSPKETVIDNWEVVNDRGTPTGGEIAAAVVLGVIVFFVIRLGFHLLFMMIRLPAYDVEYEMKSEPDFTSKAPESVIRPDEISPAKDTTLPNGDQPFPGADSKAPEPDQNAADRPEPPIEEQEFRRPRRYGWLFGTLQLIEVAVPLMLFGWPLFTRPKIQGFIYLTNWRLLYFAFGQNRFRSLFDLRTANLADILGVHTFYSEGAFGKKRLRILIHTRFRDGILIEAGNTASVVARLPILGKLLDKVLIRDTMGKDAFTLLPVLYSRIRQNTGAAATSSVNY